MGNRNTKTYTIHEGSIAGVYCSYCKAKTVSERDEDSGAFFNTCDCDGAQAENRLINLVEEATTNLETHYSDNAALMEKNENEGQLLYHENAITELHKLLGILPSKSYHSLENILKERPIEEIRQYVKSMWDELFP